MRMAVNFRQVIVLTPHIRMQPDAYAKLERLTYL